jgi:hypothetical protein
MKCRQSSLEFIKKSVHFIRADHNVGFYMSCLFNGLVLLDRSWVGSALMVFFIWDCFVFGWSTRWVRLGVLWTCSGQRSGYGRLLVGSSQVGYVPCRCGLLRIDWFGLLLFGGMACLVYLF